MVRAAATLHFPFRFNSPPGAPEGVLALPQSLAQCTMVGQGNGGGGTETAALSPAACGGGKRGRVPEEDVYVDKLHSHKRYLSEIMASSMNGLSVGDSVADNTTGSPMKLENAPCFRDEMIIQYSPISEESEDHRSYDTQVNTCGNQTDMMGSPSISPTTSPSRLQKPHTWFSYGNSYPLPSCSLSALASSNVRRGTEHEGCIPSSPNDICYGGDLRRTALLRSVQMRVQGPHPSDLLLSTEHDQEQERPHIHADELEHKDENLQGVELGHRSWPKSMQCAEFNQRLERNVDYVEGRSEYDVTSCPAPCLITTCVSNELNGNVDDHK